MTPFAKLLRGLIERAFGKWYEGEEPPLRFERVIVEFCAFYPAATKGEWVKFTLEFAKQSYREGYQRGMERNERVVESALPELPPELTADLLDSSWRDRPFEDVGPVGIPGEEEVPADPPDPKEDEWTGP